MNDERGTPALRIILGTSDRELERRLIDELPGEGVVIVARCLDGATLLDACASTPAGVVLVSAGLHGLTEATLVALHERRMPVVLLAANERQVDRFADVAAVPASAPTSAIAEALTRAATGTAPVAAEASTFGPPAPSPDQHATRGQLLAVTSGKAAPGKTTLAIALAAGLASRGDAVVLVDADLRGGNIAPYLNVDPRRGLVGLANGSGDLRERVLAELQDGPESVVLAGVERPELGRALSTETLLATLALLRAEFDHVVVDLGAPPDADLVSTVDDLLVVTAADLVSLWNTRVALGSLGHALDGVRTRAIVNRREGQEHYDQTEIEAALALPVLGVVREDRASARRAIERQVPFTAVGGAVAGDLRHLVAALDSAPTPLARPAPRALQRTAWEVPA